MAVDLHSEGQFTLLDEIVHITMQMLRLSEAAEWDELSELETRRRKLVLECFQVTPPADAEPAQRSAQAIRSILAMDEQILIRCKLEMRHRSAELSKFQKGKVMSKAYSRNSI